MVRGRYVRDWSPALPGDTFTTTCDLRESCWLAPEAFVRERRDKQKVGARNSSSARYIVAHPLGLEVEKQAKPASLPPGENALAIAACGTAFDRSTSSRQASLRPGEFQ